jgi:hypothetical protein
MYILGVVCAGKYVRTRKGHCCKQTPIEARAIFQGWGFEYPFRLFEVFLIPGKTIHGQGRS